MTPTNGTTICGPALAAFPTQDTPWGIVVDLGPLQVGQYREVVLPMKLAPDAALPFLSATLELVGDCAEERVSIEATDREPDGGALSCEIARLRAAFIDTCTSILLQSPAPSHGAAEPKIAALAHTLSSSEACGDERVVAMLCDVTGRMTKAMTGADRFARWGRCSARAAVKR